MSSPAPPPLPTPIIRLGTPADASLAAPVIISSLVLDPQFPYRYHLMDKYPEDLQWRFEVFFRNHIRNPRSDCLVAELPSLEDPQRLAIVSVAIWELQVDGEEHSHKAGFDLEVVPRSNRRPINEARHTAFKEALKAGTTQYFSAERYGPRRLSLECMATDPRYFRRGAGQALMDWGVRRAREESVIATAFASEMGKLLYKRNGFEELGDVVIGVEGEEERVSVTAMIWVPEKIRGSEN